MFKNGDKIRVNLPGYEDKIGTVDLISEDVLIVKMPDKSLVKVLKNHATIISETEDPDVITISREDFDKAVCSVLEFNRYKGILKDTLDIMVLTASGAVICTELSKELFGGND